MAASKKVSKGKCTTDDVRDFRSQSQFLKDSPKGKKAQKRVQDDYEEEDISRLIGQYQTSIKKKKIDVDNLQSTKETRQKIFDLVGHQLQDRKQCNDNLFKRLSETIAQVEAEYNAMKENEPKLEHLMNTFMKCMQQATATYKQKLNILKDINATYKKEVEGLLIRGAMKPDDRPLWFDVYRAFPPQVEPKFARPKPEITPIKQIFYHEDVVRAKFHSQGHGIGPVNMLAQGNDTQTKRLVSQYEKLKSEGVAEEELIEKSATAVGIERKEQYEAATASRQTRERVMVPNPGSVTAQIFSDTDLKNIFKE